MTIDELNTLRDLLHKLSVETPLTTEESEGILTVIDVIKEVKKEAIEAAEHTEQKPKKEEGSKAVKITKKMEKVFNSNYDICYEWVCKNGYNGIGFDRLECDVKIIDKSYKELEKLLYMKLDAIKFKSKYQDVTNDINALKKLKATILNHRRGH